MRYWWVNQKQTYRHEVPGGFLWSPKRKANGHRNPFYEFMREVAPGDLVFSFADARIRAVGVARSHAYEAPKPEEFGAAGERWDDIGWRVDVRFNELHTEVQPRLWMGLLRPLLPERYSPLRPNGLGLQSMYLTELSPLLALALASLIGDEVVALARGEEPPSWAVSSVLEEMDPRHLTPEVLLWEEHLRRKIEANESITPTDREALVLARRGQGLFRRRVEELEDRCRVTHVDRREHLRASHCKPWRDSDDHERLDADNGLLLTPSIDHLFDRGFISFRDDGRLLVSPVAHRPSLARMGVETQTEVSVGEFRRGQRVFLEYHRDAVFLQARVKR